MLRVIRALAMMLFVLPLALHAQGPRFNVQFRAIEFETGSEAKMAAYGALTGAAGLLLGGLVGAALSGDRDEADSWVNALEGAVIGGTVGESLMLPVGVHLANDREGDLLLSMPASLAIGVAGAALARNIDSKTKNLPILILTPLAQLVASIAIEKNTGGN
jgi:hypothetical protein